VGLAEGAPVGEKVGAGEGASVGCAVGAGVGERVGVAVGDCRATMQDDSNGGMVRGLALASRAADDMNVGIVLHRYRCTACVCSTKSLNVHH
jgi:hypothetical protein